MFKIGPGAALVGIAVVEDPAFWLVTGPKTNEPDPLDEGGEGWGVGEGRGRNDVDELPLVVVLCVVAEPNTIAPGEEEVCGEFVYGPASDANTNAGQQTWWIRW